jgi:hypothetical protein
MVGRRAWPGALVIPRLVLLAVTALASSLILAATNPASISTPAPAIPALPQTQPGLSHDEGVFLVTNADDGSSAVYFIAGNARHSITTSDMQLELQVNPLWPVRQVSQDEALNLGEGAPIGNAHTGLIGASAADTDDADDASTADAQATYAVAPGDSASKIARRFGIDRTPCCRPTASATPTASTSARCSPSPRAARARATSA